MSDDDTKLPDKSTVSISPFVEDQMFQRWLLSRVHQRKEMEFERGQLPPVVGFLTGLDDLYFSVSTSEAYPRSKILPRSGITGVSETGRSLHELQDSTQDLIRRYTQKIHRSCAEQLVPSVRMRPAGDRIPQQTV